MSVYFNEAKLWRWILTDNMGATISILDRLAYNVELVYELDAPWYVTLHVPSDDPLINILHTDGLPYLAEGVRQLHGFRRDVTSTENWILHFSGRVEQIEDATRTEDAITRVSAWDAWRWAYNHSCVAWLGGTAAGPIGADGYPYLNSKASDIIRTQMNMICGQAPDELVSNWAPIGFDEGDFDTDDDLPTINQYKISQGMSLGELMTDLSNGGYCDINLRPALYYPALPGCYSTIDVFARSGQYQPGMVFGWDKAPHSLVAVSRLQDGTQRANKIQYYGGQAGAPVPVAEDTSSQAKYGVYEESQQFPGYNDPKDYPYLQALAAQEVNFRLNGQMTLSITPAAERAPSPLRDYHVGTWLPVYWSEILREDQFLIQRIQKITLAIDENGLERVSEILSIVSFLDQPVGQRGGLMFEALDPAIQAAILASGGVVGPTRRRPMSGVTRPFRLGP